MVVNLPTVDVIKVLVGEDFLARAVKTDEYFINGAVKNHILHRAEEARRGMGISFPLSKKLLSPMKPATNFVFG